MLQTSFPTPAAPRSAGYAAAAVLLGAGLACAGTAQASTLPQPDVLDASALPSQEAMPERDRQDHNPVAAARGSMAGWKPVAHEKLDETRGGFEMPGLQVSFGIERAVYINGSLVVATSINIPDVARMTAEQASHLASTLGPAIVANTNAAVASALAANPVTAGAAAAMAGQGSNASAGAAGSSAGSAGAGGAAASAASGGTVASAGAAGASSSASGAAGAAGAASAGSAGSVASAGSAASSASSASSAGTASAGASTASAGAASAAGAAGLPTTVVSTATGQVSTNGLLNVIQNGPGNAAAVGTLAGTPTTVIQNTLNNQSIRSLMTIDASVNTLQAFRSQLANTTLQNALIRAASMR